MSGALVALAHALATDSQVEQDDASLIVRRARRTGSARATSSQHRFICDALREYATSMHIRSSRHGGHADDRAERRRSHSRRLDLWTNESLIVGGLRQPPVIDRAALMMNMSRGSLVIVAPVYPRKHDILVRPSCRSHERLFSSISRGGGNPAECQTSRAVGSAIVAVEPAFSGRLVQTFGVGAGTGGRRPLWDGKPDRCSSVLR